MKKYKDGIKPDWWIEINKVRTEYVVLEDLSRFMGDPIHVLHPNHPDYLMQWAKETKRCIEGVWSKQFDKWRWMPGSLYFYGKFGILQHLEKGIIKYIRPYIVDFIWDYAYDSTVCRGFSGFEKDEEYTCHLSVKQYLDGDVTIDYVHETCFKEDGTIKIYKEPYQYLFDAHSSNLGKPLFHNITKDELILGSRGSSKSYWVALGELEYRFVFYDAKSYKQYKELRFNGMKSEQCVGAENVDKSSELLDKFYDSQIAKANSSNKDFVKWFGIWDEESGEESLVPCPFYKMSKGTLKAGNKKNPYRHEYAKKQNGRWIPQGSKTKIFHVNYSSKKGDGETAASGGRYNFSNVEEVGLMPTYTKVKGHNEETVKRGGERFGVQWAQGTSGLVEYIQAAKDIMLNPESYGVLSFPNQFGTEGKNGRIARFVPAYITHFRFKDEHGNTDFERAIQHENNERARMADSDDPSVLRLYRMNRPCYINEMWLTDKGYYFPYEELALREQELMNNNLYQTIGTAVDLVRTQGGDITYNINHNAKPINTFPVDKDMDDPSGSIVIYEFPETNPPLDMYAFVGHDPYVEEDIDRGGSLGVTYMIKNPKYISQGYTGNIIVAAYIGKPLEGLDQYYDNQCKLLEFYNATQQSLWYEKNRGDLCRAYYINNHKINYLALTPQRVQGSSMHQKTIRSFGFVVGNKSSKLNLIKLCRDWLTEETEFKEEDGVVRKKMNLFRIPDLFLIRQLMMFNMEDNFDGVSAFLGCTLGLREYQSREADEILVKKKRNAGIYRNLLKASMRTGDRNVNKSKKSSIFDLMR
jgi:hypothetical protein